jgi:hypothetical protein
MYLAIIQRTYAPRPALLFFGLGGAAALACCPQPLLHIRVQVYMRVRTCDMYGVYVYIRVNENTRFTQRGPRPRQSAHVRIYVYICMRTYMCGVYVYTRRTSLPRQFALASSLPLTFMHSSSAIDSSSLCMCVPHTSPLPIGG